MAEQELPQWVQEEVEVTRAEVEPGEQFWHLEHWEYVSPKESQHLHHIFVVEPHDHSVEMHVNAYSAGSAQRRTTRLEKPEREPAGNIPMWGGETYDVHLEGLGVTASDIISGLQIWQNQHVSFRLWWVLATGEGREEPEPEPDPEPEKPRLAERVAELEDRVGELEGYHTISPAVKVPA